MSRDADYLRKRGWVRGYSETRGFIKAVLWRKDGEEDAAQWQAVKTERLKNPKVRARFDSRRKADKKDFIYESVNP